MELIRNPSKLVSILHNAAWSSDDERKIVVQSLLALGGKIPIKTLTELVSLTLEDKDKAKVKKKLQVIGEVIAGAPSEMVKGNFEMILRMIAVDRTKTIINIIGEKLVHAYPTELIDTLRNGNEIYQKIAFKVIIDRGQNVLFRMLADSLLNDRWPSRKIGMFALAEIGDKRAIPIILEILKSGSLAEKLYSVELLSSYKSNQMIQIFKEQSKNAVLDVQIKLAWALGELGTAEVIDPLLEIFEQGSFQVKIQAIRSLAKVKEGDFVERLLFLLEDPDRRIRAETINVLAKLGTDKVVEPLVNRLKDVDSSIQTAAFDALASLGKEGKIDQAKIIVNMLKTDHQAVRGKLRDMMDVLRNENILHETILSLAEENFWTREVIARALIELKEFNITEPMIKMLDHPLALIRRFAIEVLTKIKDPAAKPYLLQKLKDEDWWVVERAIAALGELHDRSVTEHLLPFLKDDTLRGVTVDALNELGDPTAVEAVLEVIDKGHKEVRISMIRLLERLGDNRVIEPLTKMMNDPDVAVRFEAANALKKLRSRLTMGGQAKIGRLELTEERVVPLLDGLLLSAKKQGANDVYLFAGEQPHIKVHGEVRHLYPLDLTPDGMKQILYKVLNEDQIAALERLQELDFSYIIEKKGRFRVNVFHKKEGLSAVFRIIPDFPPTIDQLDVPLTVKELCNLHRGLVLCVGSTGVGKTTTLASLIDYINKTQRKNIISIEEPIEYIHRNIRCQVTQREVGVHTQSFIRALRSALREDPDVICIGELRDAESIQIAVTAAETGHLVLGTLHAFSAAKAIDRIISTFPPSQQGQIRIMLAENLKGVIAQQLVRRADGSGRRAAFEVLLGTPPIANLIRERKIHQIYSVMMASAEEGMITMDQHLYQLAQRGEIDKDEAYARAYDKAEIENLFEVDQQKQARNQAPIRIQPPQREGES